MNHGPLVASPYPRVVGHALRAAARVQVGRWDRALRDVRRVQEATLAALLDHARGTEFGRAHGFERIRDYEGFARRVPVGDYDSFSPYIDRMRAGRTQPARPRVRPLLRQLVGQLERGQTEVLAHHRAVRSRLQQRAGTDTVMRYLRWSGDSGLFAGFTLGLFPPTTMSAEGPVLVTSNPALMMTKMPAVTRPVLPARTTTCVRIANYDEKLGVIAERYLDHDVRAVTGTTCWFTLLFEKVLAAARARGRDAPLDLGHLAEPARPLRRRRRRRRRTCPIIRELVGRDDVTLVDTYNATEGGVYAASDFTGAAGMLMLPHRGTFFEFVPLETREQRVAARVPLWARRARPRVRHRRHDGIGPLRVRARGHRPLPVGRAPCASSSWGASRAASR